MKACAKIETLLEELLQRDGASDLIITVGKPPQLRVFNQIESLDYPDLTAEDTENLCTAILTQQQTNRFRLEKELDLSLQLNETGRFRINIYLQRGYFALAARRVMERIPSFEELGLPPITKKIANLRRGLVLLTGPTGTGKSTTVAAIVDRINQTTPCHIISIEDPIEYVHTHTMATVDQREVGEDTNTFHDALRRVLRQSPDVVVIGEIRDRESAQAAITLAETGHLILATLHTRGAVASISRLIDMFPPEQSVQVRSQLSDSLEAVIWQQLLNRNDSKGLVLACEVMIAIQSVRSLIRQGRIHEIYSIIQTGKKFGMCTMEQSVEELVKRGVLNDELLKNKSFAHSNHLTHN